MQLIRALSHETDKLLVHDKHLNFCVRELITKLNKRSSVPGNDSRTPSEELAELFKQNGPSLIRAIIGNLHLLNSDMDIEKQFELVADKLSEFLKKSPGNNLSLLKELNRYTTRHNETAGKFISLLIRQIDVSEELAMAVFRDPVFTYSFQFIFFRQLTYRSPLIPILCNYLTIVLNQNYSDDYFKYRIIPLIQAYTTTREAGLRYLFDMFRRKELKKNGSLALAHFGDSLFWFIQNEEKQPDHNLIHALFLSFDHIRNRANKDRLMLLLINTWANDIDISEKLKKRLYKKSLFFYRQFNYATVQLIKEFSGIGDNEEFFIQVNELYKKVIENDSSRVKSIIRATVNGNIPAVALRQIEDDRLKFTFYLEIKTSLANSPLKIFIQKLTTHRYFEILPREAQHDLLSDTSLYNHISIGGLENIRGLGKNDSINNKILELIYSKRRSLD